MKVFSQKHSGSFKKAQNIAMKIIFMDIYVENLR